ncbi:MAG: DegT/DnrJ/EryC1/StrS family aminotransferase [Myxococcales bacterium]|nr:DegT/DnrJ/EryC1/StrS family aminotransferase [Myxococcales bacterium]MCB9707178.1 DegT/DnrJ/EryC1/StrS family aminotransferase [Myxococcales bacterium]
MPVPLLDLGAQHRSLSGELSEAFERVLQSGEFILGSEVTTFEAAVSQFLDVKHAIGVSSGSDALLAALMALHIGPGDEVVTSSFSFFATAGCIVRLGAKPVFIDIDPKTYNMDPSRLEAAITPRTKAIIPVHLYGQPCDMAAIDNVARSHGLAIVEDAAQAIGSRTEHGFVGSLGNFGCFSFFPSKNLGALGDGGLLTTNDDALAKHARILRAHGADPKYYHQHIGGNFRLDALQAAFLGVKLKHLYAWIEKRRACADRYDEMFRAARLDPDFLTIPHRQNASHVFHQYVIRTAHRARVIAQLQKDNIGHAIYYPLPLHMQPCFAHLDSAHLRLVHAEQASEQTLALPIYPELSEAQQTRVVESVVTALSG